MKKLWITYAWKDNEDKDIDFIVKALDETDIELKFDKRNLIPGQRLWQQIGGHITDPNECESWGIVLTKNSVQSEGCIEELSYALDRALSTKGDVFPIFALLHEISYRELPPALKIRLCIALENNDWVKQVISAVNKTAPGFTPDKDLSNSILTEHKTNDGFCLEIKPRFDRISPFSVVVDYNEKKSKNVTNCMPGPAGMIPSGGMMTMWHDQESTLTDGTHCWIWQGNNEANSTSSYYLFYKKCPKRIWFGHPKTLQMHEF